MGEKEQTALACCCRLKFSEGAAGVFEKLRVRPPYNLSTESKIDVLANQKIARFALLQSSREPLWTMVRRGDSRATSVWDHQLRAYWNYSEEQIKPVVVVPAGSLQMRINKTTKGTIAAFECEDENLKSVRIELEFADRRDLMQHAPALLWLLFGGRSCHRKSGLPLAQLEELGCLVAARASVGEARVTELVVDDLRIVDVRDDDFRPPEDFSPFDDGAKGREVPPPSSPEGVQEIDLPRFPNVLAAQRSSLTTEDALTPDCIGSTRHGAMTFLFHQDALDHASSLINQLAPLLGTATISGGTLSLPWVAALRALAAPPPAGVAPPPGAGLATLLHVPRAAAPPSGGTGLFDALAVRMIRDGEEMGRSVLQREAATGALLNSMRGWTSPLLTPLTTTMISALFATGGDLRPLTTAQRVAIADAHELGGIGTFRLNGLPTESEEASVPGVATGRFLGVTGTVAFGAMPPGLMLFPAMIGTSGEISLGLTPPPVTLTAAAVWRLDPVLVATTHVVSILGCLLVPLGCVVFATVATALTTFLANQLTTVTARTTGVSFIFELRFEWDQARGVLTPKMRTLSTAGAITVIPTYTSVPNLIRFQIEQLISITGNTLNLWLPMVARAIENAIETGLRQLGCEFPPSIPPANHPVLGPSPNAVSGSVRSVENSHLLLDVELAAAQDGVGPFATQAADADTVRRDLQMCHAVMRSDLARPPGSVTIVGAGAYAGLGVNQNALNHYVFAHWRQGDYTIDISDVADLAKIAALAPPGTFVTALTRLHAWPASCPRVEVAETPLANNGPSLLTFFDDWRICFETLPLHGETDGPGAAPKLELSFNAKAGAKATVDFPFVPQVLFDMATIDFADERTWQFVDLNNPLGALTFDPKAWRRVASEIIQRVLRRFDVARLVAPANPVRSWRRPIPSGRQQVFLKPQTLYMELLARRRALYMLPTLDAAWLEFFDNSGAPLTASLLSTTAAPLTSITLTRLTPAQGTRLAAIFTAGMPPAFFIPP